MHYLFVSCYIVNLSTWHSTIAVDLVLEPKFKDGYALVVVYFEVVDVDVVSLLLFCG